jgi:mono/diheme cytochrome c family protein
MKIRIAFILSLAALAWAAQSSVGAQGSVNAGVYTAEQAKRGEMVYADNCASCHGADLSGGDPIPGLVGAKFQGAYKTVGDLFEKINSSMPAYAPGSLTPEQTADVLANILSVNKYPAGSAPLAAKADALKSIAIEPAK